MARYEIITPEQVRFHYEVAGLMSRAMAWLVDQLILLAARVGIVFALARGGEFGYALILLAFFVLEFGYFAVFELYQAGQTPGKQAFGLRTISAQGSRLLFADVMIRNLLRYIDWLPFFMLLGGLTAFLDPFRRRLGDLAADTLVVRDARLVLPDLALEQQNRVNSFQADVSIRSRILARVTRDERDLMLDLMARRDQLDESIREDLFRQAADLFRARYALPQDLNYLSDEQTVLNLALVVQSTDFTR